MLLVLVFVVGCGSGDGRVAVSGKVTLDGKPLSYKGVVRFLPTNTDGVVGARPGMGRFSANDGSYHVESFKSKPGLSPGTYVVTVESWEVPPQISSNGERVQPKSAIPDHYSDGSKSGLTLTIKNGDSAKQFDIEIKSTP